MQERHSGETKLTERHMMVQNITRYIELKSQTNLRCKAESAKAAFSHRYYFFLLLETFFALRVPEDVK